MTLQIDFTDLEDIAKSSPHSQQRELTEMSPVPNNRRFPRAGHSPAPALLPIRVPFNPQRGSTASPAASPPRSIKSKSTMLATKFKSGSRTIYDVSLSKFATEESYGDGMHSGEAHAEEEMDGEMPPPSLFATVATRASAAESGRSGIKEVIAGTGVIETYSRETQPDSAPNGFDVYSPDQSGYDDAQERHDQRGHHATIDEPSEAQIQHEFDSLQGGNHPVNGEKRTREAEESGLEEEMAAQRKKDKKKRKKNRKSAAVSNTIVFVCWTAR